MSGPAGEPLHGRSLDDELRDRARQRETPLDQPIPVEGSEEPIYADPPIVPPGSASGAVF
jgi:hypothetical protein